MKSKYNNEVRQRNFLTIPEFFVPIDVLMKLNFDNNYGKSGLINFITFLNGEGMNFSYLSELISGLLGRERVFNRIGKLLPKEKHS